VIKAPIAAAFPMTLTASVYLRSVFCPAAIAAALVGTFGCHHGLRLGEEVVDDWQCVHLDRRPLQPDQVRIPLVPGLDPIDQCWYSEQLRAMGEPNLADLPLAADELIVRFTYLRTFHRAISVRVERREGRKALVAIELDREGGGKSRGVRRRVQRALQESGWQELRAALDRATIWDHPTEEFSEPKVLWFDGAQWIFESRSRDRYHIVPRHSHSVDEGALRELGLLLLRIGDMLPKREEIYE
jgi:hypothetical protein